MGAKERRERDRQETREKILGAAREMFAADGVEAVTMRAIADRIEYTPTAIYHHFADKQALITELVHTDLRALAQRFQAVGGIANPLERLERIGMEYVEFGLAYPAHYRFLFMTQHPDDGYPKEPGPEGDAYGLLRATVSQAFEMGLLREELADVDEVAQMCWSSVHGVVSLTMIFCADAWIQWRDPRKTAKQLLESMTRGIARHQV